MRFSDLVIECREEPLSGSLPAANLVVRQVWPDTLADAAGIRPGDLYLADGQDADAVKESDLQARWAGEREVTSRFLSADGARLRTVVTKGFPFGMHLGPTLAAMCVRMHDDWELVDSMCEAILDSLDDGIFRQLAQAAMNPKRDLGSRLIDWVVRWRLKKADDGEILRLQRDNPPPRFVVAAWLAYNGEVAQARKALPPDHPEVVFARGNKLAALYHYTIGWLEWHEGECESARETWLYAHKLYESSKRIVQTLEQQAGYRLPAKSAPRVPRPFPGGDCELAVHDPLHGSLPLDAPKVRLRDSLQQLRSDQLLTVIMLGGYRANGYYSKVMDMLAQMYPVIGRHFPEICIVTEWRQGDRFFSYWMEGEERARERNLPLLVLTDLNSGELHARLQVRKSPRVFMVDHVGRIVHESALATEEGIWQALAHLEK